MAVLIVRNIDDGIVQALKERAASHSRSAEAEHRLILANALLGPSKKSFAQVLACIPNVGEDKDFERNSDGRDADVFD